MSKHEEAIRDLVGRIGPDGCWGASGAADVARAEYEAARREVEQLRVELDRVAMERDAEIIRLRALLKGALVPCPKCGGKEIPVSKGGPCSCSADPYAPAGLVPWKEEP